MCVCSSRVHAPLVPKCTSGCGLRVYVTRKVCPSGYASKVFTCVCVCVCVHFTLPSTTLIVSRVRFCFSKAPLGGVTCLSSCSVCSSLPSSRKKSRTLLMTSSTTDWYSVFCTTTHDNQSEGRTKIVGKCSHGKGAGGGER